MARVVGIVLMIAAVLVFLSRSRAPRPVVVSHGAGSSAREVPLDSVPAPRSTGSRTPVPVEGAAPSDDETPAGASPRDLEVSGWVLEDDGTAMPRVQVTLRGRNGPEESAQATTSEDGAFLARLDSTAWKPGELCNVHVADSAGNRLFTGTAVLGTGMTLLLPRALCLHGELEIWPASRPSGCAVRIDVPSSEGYASDLFVGRAALDSQGRFSLAARAPSAAESFLVRFDCGGVSLGPVEVPMTELASEAGARIVLERRRLVLRFRDPAGAPLADVEVRTSAAETSADAFHASASSNADGRAELLLPPETAQLCAGKEGFSPRLWTVEGARVEEGEPQEVVLAGPSDCTLTGCVLDPDGGSLAGAYVSAAPWTSSDVGWAAQAAVLSDANGDFSLGVPCDLALEVVATHPRFGMTPSTFLDERMRRVTVQFAAQGSLRIDLSVAPSETVTRPGPIRTWLCDRRRDRAIVEHGWQTPLVVSRVPEGEYNLLVAWDGMDVYGETSLDVHAGEDTRIELELVPMSWVRGTVVDASGEPVPSASVELSRTVWPHEVAAALGRTVSGRDGTFRVRAGASGAPVTVRARCADGRSAEWSGNGGSTARLVLPDR